MTKRLLTFGLILWSLFVFLTDNSPEDVRSRTSGWMSLPVVRSIPQWFVAFAGSRWTLAITCLILGGVLGWSLHVRRGRLSRPDPMQALASRARRVAVYIDGSGHLPISTSTLSDLNVVIGQLADAGLAVPPGGPIAQFKTSYYLHQVATYIGQGQIARAKSIAQHLVNDWDNPRRP